MRGLDDHRNRDLEVAHPRQHAHAVEIGHDEIENQQIDMGLVGGLHARQRRLAALDAFRLIAETARHGFEKPALDGIVVGDQNGRGHVLSFMRADSPLRDMLRH